MLRYCRNPLNVISKMLSTFKGPRMALLKIQPSHFQTQMSCVCKTYKNKKGHIYGIGDKAVNIRELGFFSPTQRASTVFILEFQCTWLYDEFI